jgi:two-component system chemotaxis response regulator CheY
MDTNIDKQLPILVVNEVLLTRKIVKSCLCHLGFENIIEAESGSAALEQMKIQSFQLVISEWDVSRATGIELLKHLRDTDSHRDLPVLMLTSDAKKEDVVEAVKAGVSNYLMRPFTPDQLQSKLDAIFCIE